MPVEIHFRRQFETLRTKVVTAKLGDNISSCLAQVLPHFFPSDEKRSVVLKLGSTTGSASEYIFFLNSPLGSVVYIRNCSYKSQPAILEVVQEKELAPPLPMSGLAEESVAGYETKSLEGLHITTQKCIDVAEVKSPLCCKIIGISTASEIFVENTTIFVTGALYYGSHLIGEVKYTDAFPAQDYTYTPTLDFGACICDLPRETIAFFAVFKVTETASPYQCESYDAQDTSDTYTGTLVNITTKFSTLSFIINYNLKTVSTAKHLTHAFVRGAGTKRSLEATTQ